MIFFIGGLGGGGGETENVHLFLPLLLSEKPVLRHDQEKVLKDEGKRTQNEKQVFGSSGLYFLHTARAPSCHSSQLRESLRVNWSVRHLTRFRSVLWSPFPAAQLSSKWPVLLATVSFKCWSLCMSVSSPQGVRVGGGEGRAGGGAGGGRG